MARKQRRAADKLAQCDSKTDEENGQTFYSPYLTTALACEYLRVSADTLGFRRWRMGSHSGITV